MNREQISAILALISDPNQVASRNNSLLFWVNSAFFGEIHALFLELAAQKPADQHSTWLIEQTLSTIEDLLAANGQPKAIATLFSLIEQIERQRDLRRLAALLASQNPPEILFPYFASHSHKATFASLLLFLAQELVLHRLTCNDIPSVVQHVASLKQHPLAQLPLDLFLELELDLPDYLPRFSRTGHLEQPTQSDVFDYFLITPPFSNSQFDSIKAEAHHHPKLEKAFQSCFRAWSRSEIASFQLTRPLPKGRLPESFLLDLGLEALQAAKIGDYSIRRSRPELVYRMLIGASAYGAAYGGGVFMAEARLNVLNALRQLVPSANWADFEAQIVQWEYWQVSTNSDWFNQDYDLFVLLLSPDRQQLVSIAATSTD